MMDLASLDWDLMSVDLTEQGITPGGTADPARHLYQLLPDVLAARIEKLPPYEYCGQQVELPAGGGPHRRQPGAGGAELMSWPPLEYTPKPRKRGQAPGPGTTPARSRSRCRPCPSRQSRGSTWPPASAAGCEARCGQPTATPPASTCSPRARGWPAPGNPRGSRPPALKVRHDKDKEVNAAWATGGPEGILSRLEVAREFPEPEALAQDAEAWLRQRDGVIAAVTHHPAMGYHGAGTGLMPSERQRLTEWAAQALEPQFKPVRRPAALHGVEGQPEGPAQRRTCPCRRRRRTRTRPRGACRERRRARRGAGGERGDRRRQRGFSAGSTWPARSAVTACSRSTCYSRPPRSVTS